MNAFSNPPVYFRKVFTDDATWGSGIRYFSLFWFFNFLTDLSLAYSKMLDFVLVLVYIGGCPGWQHGQVQCSPQALNYLSERKERCAPNVKKVGLSESLNWNNVSPLLRIVHRSRTKYCVLSGHGGRWKFPCLSGSCIVNDTDVQAVNNWHEHVHVIHIYCNARELSPDCFS